MTSTTSNAAAATVVAAARSGARAKLEAYLELAKARLSSLVLFTTAVGFLLASPGAIDWAGMLWTLLGTALAAAGANALNQWVEAPRDARMLRTAQRPLPSGQLNPRQALRFALSAAIAGPAVLALAVNALTAGLAVLCILLYVLGYTPLKVRTSLNTLVGAVCGAIPPMMGWAAVTGNLELGAWLLGSLLFVWQIPHFLALAWLYREDYRRGGFRMLPTQDTSGGSTAAVILIYSAVLVPLTLTAWLAGLTGMWFVPGGLVLGGGFLALALRFCKTRRNPDARWLFLASVIYLPLILALMVVDRG